MKYIPSILIVLVLLFTEVNSDVTVGIQPLGKFDSSVLQKISKSIERIYGFHVLILSQKKMPPNAFVNIKKPRYRADSLLDYLSEIKPGHVDFILGITSKDISCTKYGPDGDIKKPEYKYKDWGIFGLGYCPGPSCIVSTFRLKHKNKAKFIDRLLKVSIHELGHNLGLNHCDTPGCVMADANETIKTVDNEKLELCDRCKSYINGR